MAARLIAALALLASPVVAQERPCRPQAMVIEWLADSHGESPAVRLTTEAGNVVVIWSNAQTSTWTLTVTSPDGMTCLLGWGTGIQTIAANLPPNI